MISLNFCNLLFLKVSQGENLVNVKKHARLALALEKRKSIFFPVPILTEKFSTSLIEAKPEGVHALDDKQFDVDYLGKIESGFHITYLNNYRSQLAFWFDDYGLAIGSAKQVQKQITLIPKFSFYIDHLVQYGLLLTSQLKTPDGPSHEDLVYCLEKLKTLAELYPPNFEHKYLLLQAEQGRYQNKGIEQLAPLYEAAIVSAGENGFLQYEALANELYGTFWVTKNLPKTGLGHLKNALQLYNQWGCTVKTGHITERYRTLLVESNFEYSTTHTFDSSLPTTLERTTLANTQTNTQESLDLSSVMKSAQAISGELALKSLVA